MIESKVGCNRRARSTQTLDGLSSLDMDIIRFEGRDLKPYGEYVQPTGLVEGEIYFAVHFLDDKMLVPELDPLVFIGRNLERGDSGRLYFQDAGSYMSGIRYRDSGEYGCDGETKIHVVEENAPFVFEFERALDVLLRCSLKRQER